jgi:archaemetzincin
VKKIQLLQLGEMSPALVAGLKEGLAREFSAACEVLPPGPHPTYAFNPARRQYCSTDILAELAARPAPPASKLLAITSSDLFIPILTFVFGEAQMNGTCAVVSTFRLHQEFYGLPPDSELLQSRLIKEAVHELGHTLGIAHCEDYNCVMAPSHAVEWIDLKKTALCEACRSAVAAL